MGNSVGIPLIIISRSDDHATTINTILRDSGHPVHCTRVNDLTLLCEQLSALNPELVLYFSGNTEVDLAAAAAGACSARFAAGTEADDGKREADQNAARTGG